MDDRYARLKGLRVLPSYREEYRPLPEGWGIRLSHILQGGPDAAATILFRKSGQNLTSVPFEEFVRKAFGLDSDTIDHFLWNYEHLSFKLYCDILRAPGHRDFLLELKSVSHHHPANLSPHELSHTL